MSEWIEEYTSPPAPIVNLWTAEPGPAYQHPAWLIHRKEQWMAWLGGLCVGLAGIFMVRYSIEQGLVGPTARIVLALLTGIGLQIIAECLRRRPNAMSVFIVARK